MKDSIVRARALPVRPVVHVLARALPIGLLTVSSAGTLRGPAIGAVPRVPAFTDASGPTVVSYLRLRIDNNFKVPETALWNFGNGQDGYFPTAGLITDASGAFYGTTTHGGAYGAYGGGTAFKLTPSGSSYTERVIWNFGNGQDGSTPAAGLIADGNGALYGTAASGGVYGNGVAFKLTPSGKSYTERVLWDFRGGRDGSQPDAGLIGDASGALYGTTFIGGAYGRGVVFKLMPSGSRYTERVLWSFGRRQDGRYPFAGLTSRGGVLYGTTTSGGAYCGSQRGCGMAFKLTPSAPRYIESVLWSFGSGQDGRNPFAGLTMKGAVLYGTTAHGGVFGSGTVFNLTPSGSSYTESVLWNFGSGQDGQNPVADVISRGGALYGTTWFGGANQCGSATCGTVFRLVP